MSADADGLSDRDRDRLAELVEAHGYEAVVLALADHAESDLDGLELEADGFLDDPEEVVAFCREQAAILRECAERLRC